MNEVTGVIVDWDGQYRCGVIQGDDGCKYPFTSQVWSDPDAPEKGGQVLVRCANGRDASEIEYLLIENIPSMTMTLQHPSGSVTHTRFRMLGGPWRMYSDSLAWMETAEALHHAVSSAEITDLSALLKGDHLPISYRGSVVKYCYGLAVELYLKWILSEAGIEFRPNHKLRKLVNRLKGRPVLGKLRTRYADFITRRNPSLIMRRAHVHGTEEVLLDWSTFDQFVRNIEDEKFILGRYATLQDYSLFKTASTKRSHEMNTYMDHTDFFALGSHLLKYKPNLLDYDLSVEP